MSAEIVYLLLGLGLLMAYTVFGRGVAKATAPGAAIIHFLGGIHEIYFPFVLMKPKLIAAMIGLAISTIGAVNPAGPSAGRVS